MCFGWQKSVIHLPKRVERNFTKNHNLRIDRSCVVSVQTFGFVWPNLVNIKSTHYCVILGWVLFNLKAISAQFLKKSADCLFFNLLHFTAEFSTTASEDACYYQSLMMPGYRLHCSWPPRNENGRNFPTLKQFSIVERHKVNCLFSFYSNSVSWPILFSHFLIRDVLWRLGINIRFTQDCEAQMNLNIKQDNFCHFRVQHIPKMVARNSTQIPEFRV